MRISSSAISARLAAFLVMGPLVIGGALAFSLATPTAAGSEQMRVDNALVADVDRATAELGRWLREKLTYHDGVLVVHDEFPGFTSVYALPASAPWSIACSAIGVTVGFGSDGSRDGGGIAIELTRTRLTEAECDVVVSALGLETLTIVNGIGPSGSNNVPSTPTTQ